MQNLFADFPATDLATWREQVITELKGKAYDSLKWQWPEGLSLEPYYTQADTQAFAQVQAFDGQLSRPDALTGAARSWVNCPQIRFSSTEQANAEALEVLEGGAEGVVFLVDDGAAVDLPALLEGIELPFCTVAFRVNENPAVLLQAYRKFAEKQEIEFDRLHGYLLYDPIGNLADQGLLDAGGLEQLKNVLTLTGEMPNFRGLTIDLERFAATGGRPAQQLSAGLSLLTEYLDQLTDAGLSAETLFKELGLTLGVGSSYFAEIAKLRVLRMLIYQLAQAYDYASYQPADVYIHALSSRWTKSILDPHTNLLRATTEAMSAILGGCNALSIAPYDAPFAPATPFSRRISRNISTILRDEAQFDKTLDPVAGTWYLQAIMHALREEAWNGFLKLEKAGGFRAALEKGLLGESFGDARAFQLKALADRRLRRVGINAYCNPLENVPAASVPANAPLSEATLPPQRQGQQYERLRLQTEAFVEETGKRPRVGLLQFGDPTMRRARAAFATDLLRCAGFLTEDIVLSPGEKPGRTHCSYDLLVLCASDEDYDKEAAQLADQIQNLEGPMVWIAGNPDTLNAQIRRSAIDGFMHLKSPALGLLTELQEKLFTP